MTVWKMYDKLEGLEKAFFIEEVKNMEMLINRAHARLMWSNDQGKRTEKLPENYENVWFFSKQDIRYCIMETSKELLFFWTFTEDY